MKRVVVGITGLPGSGKDTIADHLVREFGFTRFAFADALYAEVADAFNVTVEFLQDRAAKEKPSPILSLCSCRDMGFCEALLEIHGELSFSEPRSPRWILQQWGTEYRRREYQHYWLDKMAERIGRLTQGARVVIPDVRFDDEAQAVWSLGGDPDICDTHLWRVMRLTDVRTTHASDRGLDEKYITAYITNNGSIGELQRHVSRLIIMGRQWHGNRQNVQIDY